MGEEYVSSNQGMKLLGVPRNKFFYHVDKGDIGVLEGQTVRRNRYKVVDIIALKDRLRSQRMARRPQPTPMLIDWLMPADIPTALKLAQRVYHEDVDLAEAAVYQSWRKHNLQLSMAAFNLDRSECFATLQLVPLEEATIIDILSGRRMESSIQPDEIRPYDEPGPYTLLATSAVIHPEKPYLLYEVLYKYMSYWIEQYPEKYISRIYAQAVSDKGEMLVQHFFMLPRWDLAPDAFMLDLSRASASKIVRWFQGQLRERAPGETLPVTTPGAIRIAETPQRRESQNLAPASHSPPKPSKASRTQPHAQNEASSKQELPDGWVTAGAFAKRHKVREATLTDALKEGKLPAHEGEWKDFRASAKYALDQDEQHTCYLFIRTKQNYQPCDVPSCPCQVDKPPTLF